MIIYAFPYAFGGANIFNELRDSLKTKVKLKAFNYSGHERRLMEPLYNNIKDIVDDLYDNVIKEIDNINEEYAFLGYSMGGIVSYELYKKLRANKKQLPVYMFAFASSEPEFEYKKDDYENYSLEQLKERLLELGGTSKEVAENDELMQLMSEVIRNDLIVLRDYKVEQSAVDKIDCPMLIIRGTEEDNKEGCQLGWQKYCNNIFEYKEIEGKHFFLFDGRKDIVETVKNIIINELSI
ncbi:MAG: thioesterase domain-containing protein [Clostridium sp.]|nr:thioesterase domain-containing protein [Clostridium sp.]